MPYQRYQPYHQQFADRSARPAVADPPHRGRAPLVRRRPARRQPGPDRPDVARAQAPHVQAAGADGLQGDRGRLPGRQPDRLRLRPPAHRAGPDPGRRHDPGAGAVPRAPDRPHLRVDPRRQAGDRALLQLDLDAAAPGRLRPGPATASPTSPPAARGCARSTPRSTPRTPRSSTSTRPESYTGTELDYALEICSRGHRRDRPDAGPAADHQPAGHRRDGHPQRVRRLDRVDAPPPAPARRRSC